MLTNVDSEVPLWNDTVDVDRSKLILERKLIYRLKYPDCCVVKQEDRLLLYGPSGCSKTTLIKGLVIKCGCSMLEGKQGDLLPKWQG